MAALLATRGGQHLLAAEFTFNFDDTMTPVSGTSFLTVATNVFDIITLPLNAVVVGGDVVTETAVTGPTAYNVEIGDSVTDDRYLGTTDRAAAGRTALVPTGYVGAGESIRITIIPTVAAATAGKLTVRVLYTIRDKQDVNN